MSNTYSINNPYNGEHLADINFAGEQEAFNVMTRLKKGFGAMKNLAPFERADILFRLATLMEKNAEELAQMITRESGKTISDSRVEMVRATTTIACSAEEARRINGELLSSDAFGPKRQKSGLIYYKPLGIILAITPFNFPINLAAHKMGPAFAAGNAVFFKPSPQNYLSSKLWYDLWLEAGIPESAIELCLIDIPEVENILRHNDLACVSFTGSVAAGYAISKIAGEGMKKVLMELGGNDPLIVMPDGDIELAASTAINQRFATAGQRCTAAKRVFVHRECYDEFRDRLLAKSKGLKVGDPMLDDTFVGPVINSKAADSVMRVLNDAVKSGANILAGGTREGNLIEPTIIENVPKIATLICSETFGPVIPLIKFSELSEVIGAVNDTDYGLQAGIFTYDLRHIRYVFDNLEVGALAVNDGPGFRAEHFPFGGVKDSGVGREGVAYAIREMSFQKTLILDV